ncbi:SDR family NAD(P)-dependent oxidoreductase [Dactylosporangium sp. NPDC051484]|uniref:SDR family NAD(P)-dependent oxidoreductase n=1 Tax=Dactylosporangium sp. NPDC051484 TaxID=3154942 RepID=UPI00344C5F8F
MARLKDKVAIITGGASGLGAETCKLFAEEGARVVVADVSVDRGEAVAAAIRDKGSEAVFQRTDVASSEDVRALVARAEETFGRLDIMVANAGIGGVASRKSLEDLEEDELEEVLQINLKGLWRSLKYAAPAIRRAGGGAMTSSASVAGLTILGGSNLGGYTASKHGAVGMTKFFAAELAADGIRVNCVCPGRMQTNIDESFGYDDAQLQVARDRRETAMQTSGLRTMAHPREVAYLHLFFCSDESSFITGQAIEADGGVNLFMNRSGLVTKNSE